MDLQELKIRLNEVGFSEEVLEKLNEILDTAIAKGNLDDEARQKMMDLIDLDVDAGVLEANTMEEVSLALNSFASTMDKAVELADEKEVEVEADVKEALTKLEEAAPAAPETPAAPAVTVETTTTTAPTVPTM